MFSRFFRTYVYRKPQPRMEHGSQIDPPRTQKGTENKGRFSPFGALLCASWIPLARPIRVSSVLPTLKILARRAHFVSPKGTEARRKDVALHGFFFVPLCLCESVLVPALPGSVYPWLTLFVVFPTASSLARTVGQV